MKYFEHVTRDQFKIRGLISAPVGADTIVLHVHGFGGDFISNAFVRLMHESLPNAGIAFASINHHLSGYLVESYSEQAVIYSGGSVSDAGLAVSDVSAVAGLVSASFKRVVIQGHSFGTNIVKNFARIEKWPGQLIFLSPSDSLWLYERWKSQNTFHIDKPGSEREDAMPVRMPDEVISFHIFGMGINGTSYPLPISPRALKALLAHEVFLEWSLPGRSCQNKCLVMLGEDDPIAQNGRTKSRSMMLETLSGASIDEVPGAGHLFSGKEAILVRRLIDWLSE